MQRCRKLLPVNAASKKVGLLMVKSILTHAQCVAGFTRVFTTKEHYPLMLLRLKVMQEGLRRMMEQNNTSQADTHAANSRPEIELILIKELQAYEAHLADALEMDSDNTMTVHKARELVAGRLQSLIAQEADKLANKRVREVLERLKAMSEIQRQDTPSYGIVYDEQIDEELEELDKGDSQ